MWFFSMRMKVRKGSVIILPVSGTGAQIALDVSLSMQRSIPGRSEDNALTYHQLAVKGIAQLLEHLANNFKLEYVALVTYSTACEVKVDFTRDYDQVRQAIKKLESGDKLCLVSMLKSITGILATNWGTRNYCQVVVFTDCGLGFGSTALKGFLTNYVGKEADPEYAWITTLKPFKLNFVCMGVHSDDYFTRAIQAYQQLLDFTGLKGQLFAPKPPKETDLTDSTMGHIKTASTSSSSSTTSQQHSSHKSVLGRTAMFELIERVCETNFKPYEATLRCGAYFRLECAIILWPPPVPYRNESDSCVRTILPKLEICGYLALSDIGSPASLSRHLIVPKIEREKPSRRSTSEKASGSSSKSSGTSSSSQMKPTLDVNQPNYEFEKLEQDIREFYTKEPTPKDTDESGGDDADATNTKSSSASNIPSEMQKESMCVLLHGALKIENMAALVLLNDNWYGFIYSYADSKKKSNLMLNILPPGSNVIPWLGDINMFGFFEDIMPGETCSFPVKADKRSYSQNCVVWIKHASLQADIQKVLRHAKKMPEKTQQFYKELNRIRRAALSIGFVELLEAMAKLFEKEITHLSVHVNPECGLQLQHAAIELRKPSNRDLKISILPMQKFNSKLGSVEGSGNTATGYIY